MIIGAKRKEEVIKFKKWGIYPSRQTYIPSATKLTEIKVFKRWERRYTIWVMQTQDFGYEVGAFRTKKKAIQEAQDLAVKKQIPFNG